MKQTSKILLGIAICCTLILPVKSQLVVCENDSIGLIPLNDLGTGYFEGKQGGLFPGGTNAEAHCPSIIKKAKTLLKI